MQTIRTGLALIFAAIAFGACNGSSIDGMAQEERRDSVAYFHTSYPATEGIIAETAYYSADSSTHIPNPRGVDTTAQLGDTTAQLGDTSRGAH
jgi:hypothetical protein